MSNFSSYDGTPEAEECVTKAVNSLLARGHSGAIPARYYSLVLMEATMELGLRLTAIHGRAERNKEGKRVKMVIFTRIGERR